MALKFYWRCEGTTLDGTHDFTAGDTTASAGSAGAINSDAARFGTNGIDCPTASDNMNFAVSGTDLVDPSVGSAAFSFRLVAFVSGQSMLNIRGTSTNDNITVTTLGTDDATGRELRLRYRSTSGGAENRTVDTTNANLAENTWYACVARWDATADLIRLEVYDASGTLIEGVTGSTSISVLTDVVGVYWGEVGAVGGSDLHVDNVFIADAYAEPLEDFLDITSYTAYGASGFNASWARNSNQVISL